MLKVGLTGGIGSGKTTTTHYFKSLGVPVIDCDVIARELTEPHNDTLQQIAMHFGKDILQVTGKLNRRQLRTIIFNDEKEKKWLENLLHPLIINEIKTKLNTLNGPYCIISIPLIVRKDQFPFLDRILVVDAPPDLQLQRTCERDETDAANIRKMQATQIDRKTRLALADDVIVNEGSLSELKAKVDKLHKKYLKSTR